MPSFDLLPCILAGILPVSLTIPRSYSRLLAYEAARILFRLGCDVRIYDPAGLPQKDDVQHCHPKVKELRELSKWSDGHVWVSPEQHGNLVGPLSCDKCVQNHESNRRRHRRASSSSRLTGSHYPPAQCVLLKEEPWQLPKSAEDHSLSMLSTRFGYSDGGCACLPFPTRARCQRHTRSSHLRLRAAVCLPAQTVTASLTAWKSL